MAASRYRVCLVGTCASAPSASVQAPLRFTEYKTRYEIRKPNRGGMKATKRTVSIRLEINKQRGIRRVCIVHLHDIWSANQLLQLGDTETCELLLLFLRQTLGVDAGLLSGAAPHNTKSRSRISLQRGTVNDKRARCYYSALAFAASTSSDTVGAAGADESSSGSSF